jgi:hypothetical protein
MDQVSIKYNNIFHCKTLQNLPKFGFFGLKTNHLATLLPLPIDKVVLATGIPMGPREQVFNYPRPPSFYRFIVCAIFRPLGDDQGPIL